MDNKDMNTKEAFDNAIKYSHLSSNTDKVTFDKRNRDSIIFSIGIIVGIAIWLLWPTSNVNSDYTRTKLKPSKIYDTSCVIDPTNTVLASDSLTSSFKDIYNKTGIQTYIVVVDNQDELYSNEQAQAYTDSYYDSQINLNNGLLFTYFYNDESNNEDVYYAMGEDTKQVIDSKVITTFYKDLSLKWNDDTSDETEAFNDSLNYTFNLYQFVEEKTFFEKHKKVIIGFSAALIAIVVVVIINILDRIKNKHRYMY